MSLSPGTLDITGVQANGLLASVSFAGASPVAVPPLDYSQDFVPSGPCTVYAFLCLGSDLVWRTVWGGLLASGTRPNSSLIADRQAAGDLIFLAQWGFANLSALTYVGGSVTVYEG